MNERKGSVAATCIVLRPSNVRLRLGARRCGRPMALRTRMILVVIVSTLKTLPSLKIQLTSVNPARSAINAA